jgi:hypothetical protein
MYTHIYIKYVYIYVCVCAYTMDLIIKSLNAFAFDMFFRSHGTPRKLGHKLTTHKTLDGRTLVGYQCVVLREDWEKVNPFFWDAWRGGTRWNGCCCVYYFTYIYVCVTVCACTYTTIQVDACPTENASMLSRPSYEQIPAESLERKNH